MFALNVSRTIFVINVSCSVCVLNINHDANYDVPPDVCPPHSSCVTFLKEPHFCPFSKEPHVCPQTKSRCLSSKQITMFFLNVNRSMYILNINHNTNHDVTPNLCPLAKLLNVYPQHKGYKSRCNAQSLSSMPINVSLFRKSSRCVLNVNHDLQTVPPGRILEKSFT